MKVFVPYDQGTVHDLKLRGGVRSWPESGQHSTEKVRICSLQRFDLRCRSIGRTGKDPYSLHCQRIQ